MVLGRLAALALAPCLLPLGCGPAESRPATAPAASLATVAIEPEPDAAATEAAPAPPAKPEVSVWEQLLSRQAVFLVESGAVCGDDGRATTVLPGVERPSNLELAERAGCQGASAPAPGEAASAREVCCPSSLEIPSPEQSGGGASCAAAATEYLGMLAQSGAVPPAMAGLSMTIQQHASQLSQRDYIAHCQLPAGMSVRLCAAIRSGRAEGVTVITDPPSVGKADCVAQAVRSLALPPQPVPIMDLTRAEILSVH